MKKIPTLFEREFGARHEVKTLPIVKPELVGILNGEGIATIKWDGTGIEGIVFWLDGKPICKIKSSDFGIDWK